MLQRMTWLAMVLTTLLAGWPGRALAEDRPEVPPALAPWQAWALHGAGERLCPLAGNEAGTRICLFPTSLNLALEASGAKLAMRARLFDEGPLPLPSGEGAWVSRMTADGKPVPVTIREGLPVVWLPAGEHVLEGRLDWAVAPQSLRLPPEIGLVGLSRDGAAVTPEIGPGGELRLGTDTGQAPVENREDVRVFRLVADGVPVTVTTLFRLEVSGLARTVVLAGAVPSGTVPSGIRSPVAASLGPDGSLALDAGPGRYDVEVVARFPGRVETVGPATCPHGREIWSFRAADQGRVARPEGLPAIDPATVDVPGPWRGDPAFLAEAGASLTLRELGRGAPVGRDALRLSRELWLDFSGQGLTVRDSLTGENRAAWTLAMLPPGELGRASLAGRDQPVVLLGPDKRAGIELRQSQLRLVAEARYADAAVAWPATGYDREFDQVSARLQLPPGWRLLFASGPDEVGGSLLSGWTLLDLFLVLVLAVAGAALAGRPAGLALGLLLLLTWKEPDAPTLAWVFVLAGLGLVRVTGPVGRLAGHPRARRWALLFFALSLLGLAVMAIPFAVTQLRQAVAPQIAAPGWMPPGALPRPDALMEDTAAPAPPAPAPAPSRAKGGSASISSYRAESAGDAGKALSRDFDPTALVQTGPGLPSWQWRRVSLGWRGPVTPGQTVRLFLVPPVMAGALAVVRVALLGLALWLCCGSRRARRLAGLVGLVGLTLGLALMAVAPRPALAQGFPPADLLEALRTRLTEPPRCLPHCLGSPGLDVFLENGRLRLVCAIDAATRAALPLPAVSDWRPATVLLDGAPAPALARLGGGLRVLAEAGRHVVTLEGPAPRAVTFTITPALAPGHVQVTAPGYRVRGLDARGGLQGALECTRSEETVPGQAAPPATSAKVPAFFQVDRTIDFGLTWEVATEVVRRSPSGEAVVAAVPLLPGELPDTAEVTVRDGRAMVPFVPDRERVSWRSKLPVTAGLTLVAPTDAALVETWTVTAASFYEVAFNGIAPAARLSGDGAWQPRFLPWPGEKLEVAVSRPQPAPGALCTLERAELVCRQGRQTREVSLAMTFRAAKGGRQTVGLPPGAEVTQLTVAGRETLPTGGPGEVGFAVAPGQTQVVVHWRESTALGLVTRTPAVNLGMPAVNVRTRLELPGGRWLLGLRGDTPLGPAVLFWGWLAAVVAVALGLSFLGGTPLSRRQWLLFALGLVQATPGNFVLAVSWLPALGWRCRRGIREGRLLFNLVQVLLALLVLAALVALYETLRSGLLGLPHTQVGGNGSTADALIWTYDRVAGAVPVASVVTVPIFVFRVLMLVWAAWLAKALLAWLRWGVDCLTEGGGWRPFRVRLGLPGRLGAGGKPPGETDGQGPDRP
jgi:hypothetical protein